MTDVTVRLTAAQALVRYLSRQYVERDGTEQPFFAGMFGIFGHGNVPESDKHSKSSATN